jgi:cobalt-precorrin-7 (C5)-methyltransferase
MKVVGVGCGPGLITEEAAAAISAATLVMGSKRALELAAAHIRPDCAVQAVVDFSAFHPPDHAVVLSTGDPMFAGLGYLGGDIIPGISSLQVAASRLQVPIEEISVIMAHGKDHDQAFRETRDAIWQGRHAFIVADPKFSTVDLAAALAGAGDDLSIVVCEDLGYPEERIASGPLDRPPRPQSRLFCVLVGSFPVIPR